MNMETLCWEYGCCARTAQFSSGECTVLITHMVVEDEYRIEVYAGNRLVDELHKLSKQECADHLGQMAQ